MAVPYSSLASFRRVTGIPCRLQMAKCRRSEPPAGPLPGTI